jgi:hypothetical protein
MRCLGALVLAVVLAWAALAGLVLLVVADLHRL